MAGHKSRDSAKDLIPETPTVSSLKKAAADCRACDLWERATQTVFGEGRRHAKVTLIGEQLVIATVHPSSILRAPDDETRRTEMRRFVDDLKKVAEGL